ncbi:MAG: type VI secretion system-associated FHA domain protein TagH [Steroidobacteraceae bacterium]
MYLTLEVVSPQAASLGADRRRVVSERGLTIGRVPGNDWVIPDPYISKQHARISYANGSFFVESLGRNAIAIGTPGHTLPGNQPQPLRNGDHLFIDQYEMIVTTQQGDPPGMSVASDDPFAVLPAAGGSAATGRNPRSASIPDIWDGAGDLVDTGVVDPIDVLPGGRAKEPDPLPPVNWQRSPVLENHFEPPPVRAPAGGSPFDLLDPGAEPPGAPPAPPTAGIPDNWDRTNLTYREGAAPKATPRPGTPLPGGRGVVRENPAAVRPARPDLVRPEPPRPETARPEAVRPEPARRDPRLAGSQPRSPILDAGPTGPERRPVTPESRGGLPESMAAELASPRQPERQAWPASRAGGSAVGTELAELLRGAGLSEQDISPQMMQDLGKVLRVVVEGVMDVLRARAEIKSQFRLPLTRIQSADNNPLKHSPNVESALHTLLVQKNPGFLSTVQAFEDAFADIRNHQMAMLEGVRVAFESMLESFDPKELEKGFERAAKRGFGSAKSKYWDLYMDRFAQLSGDADDTFRRLFGDVFAEAYEKQLERLKTLARNGGKT